MRLKYLQLFILLTCLLNFSFAQITFSPYTHNAAGQIEHGGSGDNNAMGGTGIAFKSNRSLNNLNPASYSGIDSLAFVFELGVFGKSSKFEKGDLAQKKYSGNIRYITMGTRINKWWSASIGITPFSSVAYKINTIEQLEGEMSYYKKTYTGSGGINQYYFGNSFTLFKDLSLGINFGYLLGTINQDETVDIQGVAFYSIKKTFKLQNMIVNYGFQYKIDHNKWRYTIGGIYGHQRTLQTATSLELLYGGESQKMKHDDQPFVIPQKFGIGIAVEKLNKFRGGFDYERSEWSDVNFTNTNLKTRDSERFSMGMEYTPVRTMHDGGLMRWYYRIGANYEKTYMIVDGVPIDSKAVTFGVGIPLKRQLTTVNCSFEFGQHGTTENHLIKETYYTLHLNFSLQDFWFQKHKYD